MGHLNLLLSFPDVAAHPRPNTEMERVPGSPSQRLAACRDVSAQPTVFDEVYH
jgi:hypothetical protein